MNNLWLKDWLKKLRLNESAISTALGGLVVVIVGVLIYNYFSSVNRAAIEPSPEPESLKLVEEDGQLVPDKLPLTHTVMAGEDLWKISEKYFDSGYNWVDIAAQNNLVNPDRINAGQELTIPRVAVKETTKPVAVEAIEANEYLVQKGDYLWKIAVSTYGDGFSWTKIWEANKELIADPDVIEPGTLLKLPR